jgi:hypothetical protein
VKLATGAPVVQLCLPDTIEELFLEYLTKLSDSGLILEGINIKDTVTSILVHIETMRIMKL